MSSWEARPPVTAELEIDNYIILPIPMGPLWPHSFFAQVIICQCLVFIPRKFVCHRYKIFYLRHMFIGLLIALIGALILLRNLDVIQGDFWDWFWPLLLVLIGLSIILKRPGKVKKEE
jgi:hypothetical protein